MGSQRAGHDWRDSARHWDASIHLYVSVRDCELLGDSCLTHVCNFSLLSMSVIWTSWSVNVGWINVHFFLGRKETFQSIFLDVSHAKLVNEHWELGKNEKSLKYIERCLQNFAGFGILSAEGNPISWFLTEQSCEIRMGYTFPKYRWQGHMWQMGCHSIAYFFSKKMPFYIHVAEDKEKTQQVLLSFGFRNALCGWHQWKCTPEKYWWCYCPFQVFLIRGKKHQCKEM